MKTELPTVSPAPRSAADDRHLLVVIDHREARIYKTELHGALPVRIEPYDPGDGSGRHLHQVEGAAATGRRKPERKSYYEAVAASLRDADRVLIFGRGTGASSAMDHLLAELRARHPRLAARVIGAVSVDERHLTEHQLLARAREEYALREPPP
jgi:hypothetical protein